MDISQNDRTIDMRRMATDTFEARFPIGSGGGLQLDPLRIDGHTRYGFEAKPKDIGMASYRIIGAFAIWMFILLAAAISHADSADLLPRLKGGGHILMLRHALAPGTGDPPHFRLGDCRTQRNLDARGREQATNIGVWLRTRGITQARIYASQWCRCLETAALIDLGPVTPLPALNSFFQRPQDREPNLAALRDFISRQSQDGDLIILVTHFVTIAGITGESVSSGEGVLLAPPNTNALQVIGRLGFVAD